jgi:hypothetical protein
MCEGLFQQECAAIWARRLFLERLQGEASQRDL